MSAVAERTQSNVQAAIAPDESTLKRIFVIDDDEVMLLSARRVLVKEGYEVETFASALAGLARLAHPGSRPQLVLVDLKMPELNGLQVIERIRAIDERIVIAVITGYATIATAVDAMSAGAHEFLPKPFTPDELRLVVKRAAERWRLIQESERHRREREAAERRIVTFVSHQLKSPVAAAKQYLDVLLFTSKTELPPVAVDWLRRAQARLQDMVTMIDDWLTLSRLERGALCETGESACICDVVNDVVQAASGQADLAGVSLTSELPPAPLIVRGDRPSLGMVVSNLVTNAIKYNRPGGTVTATVRPGPPAAVLEVRDTGIGISTESLPHVFDEFYRASEIRGNGIPGSGLGLSICRRIVSELGGTIAVHSTPGSGTTFTVGLPLATQEHS